jgi:hypothetical protein
LIHRHRITAAAVSALIRDTRARRRMSCSAVERLSGIPWHTIYRWEHDPPANLGHVVSVLGALGYDLKERKR